MEKGKTGRRRKSDAPKTPESEISETTSEKAERTPSKKAKKPASNPDLLDQSLDFQFDQSEDELDGLQSTAIDDQELEGSSPEQKDLEAEVVFRSLSDLAPARPKGKIQKLVPVGLWGLVLLGLGLTVYGLTSFGGEEQEQATQQQAQAETVPLVVPVQTSTETGVESKVPEGQVFAKLYVPRFGKNYVREVAEGTGLDSVLNTIGIGKYTSSELPGEEGNFAVAAHRTGNGGPFRDIDKLQEGDLVFVETATAWYTYRYLDTAVIEPEQIEVIADVPGVLQGATKGGKYLTLTSCTPIYVNTQRIAVWFELVDQQPASMGMPEELKQVRES